MIGALVTASSVFATENPSTKNSAIGVTTVSKMILHDTGNLYVYFNGEVTHTEQCDDNSTFILPPDNPHFNRAYSGLLAAMHAGAPVNGYVDGCVAVWSKTMPKITRIDLFPIK